MSCSMTMSPHAQLNWTKQSYGFHYLSLPSSTKIDNPIESNHEEGGNIMPYIMRIMK